MKFDINKVYGFWNADEAEHLIGKEVIASDSLPGLKRMVECNSNRSTLDAILCDKDIYKYRLADSDSIHIYEIPEQYKTNYRPYTFDELIQLMMNGTVFKVKDFQDYGTIINVSIEHEDTIISVCGFGYEPKSFLEDFVDLDGRPAGVLVEESSDE